ncbi:MAG: N-acetylmuramoyl-L-alanine amidase [Candidatus Puniceispirillaceae bacterium]
MTPQLNQTLRLIGWMAALLVFVTSLHARAAENSVTGLRLGGVDIDGQAALRIVVETRNPAQARLKLLADPYRFVVDFTDTDWQVDGIARRGPLSRNPATAYRFGNPDPQTGRIVIEMSAPAAPVRRFTLPAVNGGGHRLVFDLVDRGPTAFQLAGRALAAEGARDYAAAQSASKAARTPIAKAPKPRPAPQAQAKPKLSIAPPQARPKKWRVFIDAGHGGKDPGAIGRSKTLEKDITLAASRELATQLRGTGLIEPILSRSDDRYLRLRERIQLARDREADVFISLHADAAPSAKARGISVFTLSDTASDKEAALLAQKENQADLIGGPDLAVEDPDAAGELLRMFQRESMNQSTYLANAILRQIRDMPGGDRRGHRFAGFAVLKAPDMPSVLVEMGFITNREDEANLTDPAYRAKLLERLARAIIAYLVEYGPRR